MRYSTNSIRLSATLLGATALASATASGAAAQALPRLEARPFFGAYIPTGDQGDLLGDGVSVGVQGGYTLTRHLSLVGSLAWAGSSNRTMLLADKVDVYQYDLGAEYRQPIALGGGMRLSPFVGLGAGGRTYQYRDRDTDAQSNVAGYGALGGQLNLGPVGLRLEARDYVSRFKGLTGELSEAKARNDVTVLSAISFSF